MMSNSNSQKPITNPLLLDSQINLVEEKKASKPKSKKTDKAKTQK